MGRRVQGNGKQDNINPEKGRERPVRNRGGLAEFGNDCPGWSPGREKEEGAP